MTPPIVRRGVLNVSPILGYNIKTLHLRKEPEVVRDHIVHVMPILRLHIDLDKLENEANIIIDADDGQRRSCISFLLLCKVTLGVV